MWASGVDTQRPLAAFWVRDRFCICEEFNVEVTVLNQSEKPLSFEEELARDVLEIITVFSARLYGSRSHKNRNLVKKLQEAAEER